MELKELSMTKNTAKERPKLGTKNFKKPYLRPRLVEYGDVAKLTASGGTRVMADGLRTFMGA
jgi:hypothetical protein